MKKRVRITLDDLTPTREFENDLYWDMIIDIDTVGAEASDLGFLLADKIKQLYKYV